MNRITIRVKVKGTNEVVDIMLFQKIYSTPEGVVNHWLSSSNSKYRVEILTNDDQMIPPDNINKDLLIATTEFEIADQVMTMLYEQRIIQMQNY
ncbi:MAG: hypothetical protein A2W99_03190 [Bacteroidetes bacterium GWF2_33_16]|nr:MAG: hypothetical protein A2X00_09825 [Bacteroidetes bacterium GWE2_32_14]OFY07899.1 MAG: hypothetical protein A2W99_03190 [Bacteroidetes bacterium GWF2_33_16]